MLDSVDKFLHYLAEGSNGSESSSPQPTPAHKMPQETIKKLSVERDSEINEGEEIKEECIDEIAVSGLNESIKTKEDNEVHSSNFGAELSELTDLIEPNIGASSFLTGKSTLNKNPSMVALKSEHIRSTDNGLLHLDTLLLDQRKGKKYSEAEIRSLRHTSSSLMDEFVKEEFDNESASELCSSRVVQTMENSCKSDVVLRTNSRKTVDLITMMRIISNKLIDDETSDDMKISLIGALENVLAAFLTDCKHLASDPSLIQLIIHLFEEALKLKENIPYYIKSQMMDLISDFLLPVFEIPETESKSDTIALDEATRLGFHQRIKEIAEKHSQGMLEEHGELSEDSCIISNEHDLDSINKLFSKRFPSLYAQQKQDQNKHLDTLGTNLLSDDLKIIHQSKNPDQPMLLKNKMKSSSSRSRKPSKTSKVRRSGTHAATIMTGEALGSSMSNTSSPVEEPQSTSNGSNSEQSHQDHLPSSKQCDSPGCISRVTCQDPHTKCVVHAMCTKMLVFVPCNLCYLMFNNLLTNEPIWKDIFTFRFNQFKCYRKMNGNRVDIAYINKHVERQFEIFNSSLNFDEEAVQTRLQESQANKYDATVDWLETDIVGFARNNKAVEISSRNSEIVQKKTSAVKKVPGPSPLQMLLTEMSSVTSINLKRKHCDSEQNSSESKTKRKNFEGKSSEDSPASNSSIELSSCDTMSAENSCSSVGSSVDRCAPNAKDAPTGDDVALSVKYTSSGQPAPNDGRVSISSEEQLLQQQQHATLATMFMAHPSSWDAFLLASTVLPWTDTPKTAEQRASARRAFDEYADSMKDGRYGQAVQEADVFLQHYANWEPAYVMLAVGLIRLGLRGRALFVCNKALSSLQSSALVMQRLKDSLSSTTNSNTVTPLAAPTLLDDSAPLGSRTFFQTRLKELLMEKSSRHEPSGGLSSSRRSSAELTALDLQSESRSNTRVGGGSASAGSASSHFVGSLGGSSRPSLLYETAGSSRSGGGGEGRRDESRFDDRRMRPTGEAVASASKNRSRRSGEIPSDVIAAYMRKSSTITEELSEQQLKDESSGLINDEQLLSLSVRQLNKLFAGLPPFLIRVLKQRRRTLKNRGYAYSCRLKRKTFSETLEYQCKKLKDSLNEVVEENQYLRSSNKVFRSGFLDLMEKLRSYEPDYQPHWELSWLLKKPERPPSLMPADSFRSQSGAEAAGNNTAEEDSGDESMWTS